MKNKKSSTKQKVLINIIVYFIAMLAIYVVSLSVFTKIKVDEPTETIEYMAEHPGRYEAESTILGIRVSKTIVTSYGEGAFELTTEEYPALFLLPVASTGITMIVLLGISAIVKKKVRKIEI